MVVMVASLVVPAVWMTAVSGWAAGMAASAFARAGRLDDIAGGGDRAGPGGGQVGDELMSAGGVGAAAGEQEEVAGLAGGGEVPGDDGAEGAGAAGDQHRAVRVERGICRWCGRGGGAGQAGCEHGGAADGGDGLARRQCAGQGGAGGFGVCAGVGVEVEVGDAGGVLALGGADEAGGGGGGEVGGGSGPAAPAVIQASGTAARRGAVR